MSAPRKSLWPCGGVLALVVVASSCVQREVARIPAELRPPPDHLIRRTANDVAPAPTEEPEPSRLSLPASKPVSAEPETPVAINTRLLVPIGMAPGGADEPPMAETEAPLESRIEPMTRMESDPLVEEPEPISQRIDLRGRILIPTSGQPPQSNTPLIVFAVRDAGPESAPHSTNEPLEAPAPAPIARRIEGGFFPEFIVTSPDRGICFENQDEICHSFFSSSEPNAFDLGMLGPGESRTVAFQHTGPVHVYCSLHAGKQLSLFVAPSPHHALVEADGTFVIEGLAPGDYYLQAWGDGQRSRCLPVNVHGGDMQPVVVHVDPEPEKGVE